MKIVSIILFALFYFSCSPDHPCYDCTTTITITITDPDGKNTWQASDDRRKCDVTESEIREFEKANSDSVTYTNGPVRIDTVTVTLCSK
jgi:alkaline phosphatase